MLLSTLALALSLTFAQAGGFKPILPQTPPRDTSAVKGTASIKGKVLAADSGRPLRRVQVSLSSPDLAEARSISTTAQGLFEFKELPAGRYTITATRPGYLRLQYGQRRPGEPGRPVQLADGQAMADANLSLPRTSTISGRVIDEVGDPMSGVSIVPTQWRYFRGKRRMATVSGGASFNQTDDTGQFRITGLEPGDYYVLAHTRTTWTVDGKPDERIGFIPTYTGGTPVPADAQRIKVGVGEDVSVGDIAMVPGRVVTISGTATNSMGVPLAGESVERVQEFAGPGATSQFGMSGGKVNADGSFTIKNVSPGEYRLSVRAPADKDHPVEGATVTVNVTGDDVAGVSLVTSPGGTIAGRIVTDTHVPVPATDTRMRVSARPLDPTSTYSSFGDNDNGRVRDDFTFEFKGVFGANRLSVSPIPPGWAVRSIEHQGKDYADVAVDLRGGERLDGVTIVLSKTLPKITGTLHDEKGRPAEGSVLIFPEDAAKWGEESRLIRSVRPDLAGAFELRNVIPGDYLAVPLEYVRDGQWADPEFLENLRERATPVKVNEGGSASISLVLKGAQ